jgi:hypothetical protein
MGVRADPVFIEGVGRIEEKPTRCTLAVTAAKYPAHSGAPRERKKPLTAASWFLFLTLTLVTGDIPLHRSRWSKPVFGSIGTNFLAAVFLHWIGLPQCLQLVALSRRVKVDEFGATRTSLTSVPGSLLFFIIVTYRDKPPGDGGGRASAAALAWRLG